MSVVVVVWSSRFPSKHPVCMKNTCINLSLGGICANALMPSVHLQIDDQAHEGSKLLVYVPGIWCMSNPHVILASTYRCEAFSKTCGRGTDQSCLSGVQCDRVCKEPHDRLNLLVQGFSFWVSHQERTLGAISCLCQTFNYAFICMQSPMLKCPQYPTI